MIYTLANSLWLAGCLPESARFHRASRRVADEQAAILRRLLAANAETEFGRGHGFSSIRSVAEYRERVPLRDYDGYREWIDRIAAGSSNILTSERVRLFEPTSGSAGASKWIPYTVSLQREFQRGIRAWIADLFLRYPDLLSGPAYWSISPVTAGSSTTAGGIPIGFEDDTSYVGGWQQRLTQAVMAVPSHVRFIPDMEAFRYATLLSLIRCRNLKLVSVWNPTFFSLLVDRLPEWGDRLARDLMADARRAQDLREALRASTPAERHARLWPELRLISCWSDANAAGPAAGLAALFPQSRMQGKGLISTEAFVSLPLAGREGAALAMRSHFLEFLPANGNPQLAHELDCGQQYSVVVTTGGGLYRYQLHDLVEVSGYIQGCPMVRFAGRQGYVSDWFGEKLNEAHVSGVMRDVFGVLGISPSFAMLACDMDPPSPGYVLYIDASEPNEVLDRAAAQIEIRLQDNFHYKYARELGQLAPLRTFRAEGAAGAYLAAGVRMGRQAGDIKMLALDRNDGWSRMFLSRASNGAVLRPRKGRARIRCKALLDIGRKPPIDKSVKRIENPSPHHGAPRQRLLLLEQRLPLFGPILQ